jgi:hypothetical protein
MQNIDTAEKAIEAFFQAFNTHDGQAYVKSLHFPHIRINAECQVNILQSADEQPPLENALTGWPSMKGGFTAPSTRWRGFRNRKTKSILKFNSAVLKPMGPSMRSISPCGSSPKRAINGGFWPVRVLHRNSILHSLNHRRLP